MNIHRILVTVMMVASCILACKKDKYIEETGLHATTTSQTTYDYLKSEGQFDTLVSLIDHFNLQDSVNKSATIFAFTDYAAKLFMKDANIASLPDFYDSVSSGFITQYLFGSQIAESDLGLVPTAYPNWGGTKAPCSLWKIENLQYVYLTSSAPAFTYYRIQYKSIMGVDDEAPGRPSDDPADVTLTCQSTGLLTSTNSLVHVFANNVRLRKL